MFNLFDGKTGLIYDYDDDDKWLDACLGPLPPIMHALVMVWGVYQQRWGGSR
jgi:hypothetical protein